MGKKKLTKDIRDLKIGEGEGKWCRYRNNIWKVLYHREDNHGKIFGKKGFATYYGNFPGERYPVADNPKYLVQPGDIVRIKGSNVLHQVLSLSIKKDRPRINVFKFHCFNIEDIVEIYTKDYMGHYVPVWNWRNR